MWLVVRDPDWEAFAGSTGWRHFGYQRSQVGTESFGVGS